MGFYLSEKMKKEVMKKIALLLGISLLWTGIVEAQENKDEAKPVKHKIGITQTPKGEIPEAPPLPHDQWSLFQIGFFPEWPSFTRLSNVYGIKLGAPMCDGYGRVYGIEPSILYSGTRYVGGIQASFWGTCLAREIYGIQSSTFGPCITGSVYGLQAVGSLGMAEEVYGAQIAPVTMCGTELVGIQFGVVNMTTKKLTGFQGGAVNLVEELDGVQLGVFNYSEKNGLQFGAINIIKNGFIPFMLLINYKY